LLEFYQYDYTDRFGTVAKKRISVVFVPFETDDELLLQDQIKDHFASSVPPDRLILLGTSARKEFFQRVLESQTFTDRLPAITRMSDPPSVLAVCRSDDGTFECFSGQGKASLTKRTLDELKRIGLMRIFRERKGILEGNGRFHYVKPSGAHSDKFIRAANVLIRGAEVAFTAFCLLDHVDSDVKHIYTDTAAINLVAYAFAALKRQMNPDYVQPTIDSYSSYGGRGNFNYQSEEDSLFLISATTTGKLEKTFFSKPGADGISRTKTSVGSTAKKALFVTLFYLGDPVPGLKVVLDLTKSRRNPDGYEKIKNYDANACELCASNVLAVRITGDQFLPQDPAVRLHLIEGDDQPKGLQQICEDFVGRGIVRVYQAREESGTRDIYLNLEDSIKQLGDGAETGLQKELDRLLDQCLPVTVRQIVYLNDSSSKALAEKGLDKFRETGVPAAQLPTIMPDTDLSDLLRYGRKLSGATLVVAAVSSSGRRLLQASQALRELQSVHAIGYLVGINRASTEDASRDLRNSLTYGFSGARSYDLRIVRDVFLPDEVPPFISSWDVEDRLLGRFLRWLDTPDAIRLCGTETATLAKTLIEARVDLLRDQKGGDGLMDNLFWPANFGSEPLLLRGTFAFWPSRLSAPGSPRSQADVYFTMSSILHELRERRHLERLTQDHHRTLLSPINFERFNDGIVQASILRASNSVELDFTSDSTSSGQMRDVLSYIFSNVANSAGEASPEFLFAIAAKRLCLLPDDLKRALKVLERSGKDIPFARALSLFILAGS
jgi:hypothetical protein